jgi:pyruvate dehydrogenase (quinone)
VRRSNSVWSARSAPACALLPRLTAKSDRKHLDASLWSYAETRQGLDELASGRSRGPLHPQHVARVVSELASEDAIFTCDVGLPCRLLGSFWHGSMANAMAQAIGAQAAFPWRQVISLSGDGGFTMLMGDLLSLSQLELPVKVIVFNNGSLGFIELEQKASGFLDTGTELVNPNFAAMAEAAGIKGVRIVDPAEVEGKLAKALAHPGPALVDAVVNRMELAMPPDHRDGQGLHPLHAEGCPQRTWRRDRRTRPIQLVEMTHKATRHLERSQPNRPLAS